MFRVAMFIQLMTTAKAASGHVHVMTIVIFTMHLQSNGLEYCVSMGKGVVINGEKLILLDESSLHYFAEVDKKCTPLTSDLLTGDSPVSMSASQLAMPAVLKRSISGIGGCILHKDPRVERNIIVILQSIGPVRRPVFRLQPGHPAHGCMMSPHSHLQEKHQLVKVQV